MIWSDGFNKNLIYSYNSVTGNFTTQAKPQKSGYIIVDELRKIWRYIFEPASRIETVIAGLEARSFSIPQEQEASFKTFCEEFQRNVADPHNERVFKWTTVTTMGVQYNLIQRRRDIERKTDADRKQQAELNRQQEEKRRLEDQARTEREKKFEMGCWDRFTVSISDSLDNGALEVTAENEKVDFNNALAQDCPNVAKKIFDLSLKRCLKHRYNVQKSELAERHLPLYQARLAFLQAQLPQMRQRFPQENWYKWLEEAFKLFPEKEEEFLAVMDILLTPYALNQQHYLYWPRNERFGKTKLEKLKTYCLIHAFVKRTKSEELRERLSYLHFYWLMRGEGDKKAEAEMDEKEANEVHPMFYSLKYVEFLDAEDDPPRNSAYTDGVARFAEYDASMRAASAPSSFNVQSENTILFRLSATKQFYVDRRVLGPYFESILRDNPAKTEYSYEELEQGAKRPEDLECVLRYLHGEKMEITRQNFPNVLQLAEKYQVKEMLPLIVMWNDFVRHNYDGLTIEEQAKVLEIASTYGLRRTSKLVCESLFSQLKRFVVLGQTGDAATLAQKAKIEGILQQYGGVVRRYAGDVPSSLLDLFCRVFPNLTELIWKPKERPTYGDIWMREHFPRIDAETTPSLLRLQKLQSFRIDKPSSFYDERYLSVDLAQLKRLGAIKSIQYLSIPNCRITNVGEQQEVNRAFAPIQVHMKIEISGGSSSGCIFTIFQERWEIGKRSDER